MLFTVLLQKHATSQVYTVKYCSTIPELEGPSTGAQINGWLWSHIQLVTSQLLLVDTFHPGIAGFSKSTVPVAVW